MTDASLRTVVVSLSLLCACSGDSIGNGSPGEAGTADHWVANHPGDPEALGGGGEVLAITALIVWGDRLLALAVCGDDTLAWTTDDGSSWDRSAFEPPPGCSPFGGVAAAGRQLVVSCEDAESGVLSVAVTDDLERWRSQEVAAAGPSFGTTIGPNAGGGITVTSLEADDPNTTAGSTLRVWTSDDLDAWQEIPGGAADTFIDGMTQRIQVFDDTVVMVGTWNPIASNGRAAPRPAVWTSTSGAPFRRSLLPPSTRGTSASHAYDLTALETTFVVVGGTDDGQIGMAWTSTDLDSWAASTVTDPASSGVAAGLWSIATTVDGRALAGSLDDSVMTWSSIDGETWQPAGPGPQLVVRWKDSVVGASAGDRLHVFRWHEATRAVVGGTNGASLVIGAIVAVAAGSRGAAARRRAATSEPHQSEDGWWKLALAGPAVIACVVASGLGVNAWYAGMVSVILAVGQAVVRRLRSGPTRPGWTWSEESFAATSRAVLAYTAGSMHLMAPRNSECVCPSGGSISVPTG